VGPFIDYKHCVKWLICMDAVCIPVAVACVRSHGPISCLWRQDDQVATNWLGDLSIPCCPALISIIHCVYLATVQQPLAADSTVGDFASCRRSIV